MKISAFTSPNRPFGPCRLKTLSQFLILPLVLITVGCIGCNREAPSGKNLLASDLIAKTPDSTLAFSIIDFHGAGLKNLNASPLSKHSRVPSLAEITTTIGNLPVQASAKVDLTRFMTTLRKSDLFDKDGVARFEEYFSRGILFFASSDKKSEVPHIGFFGRTPTKDSSGVLLDSLQSLLEQSGFSFSRTATQNASRLTVKFSETSTKLFLIATTNYFGLSTKEEDLNRLEDAGSIGPKHPIVEMPTYQKATATLQSIPNAISVSFIATQPLIASLRTISPASAESLSEYGETNPIEAILIQNGFTDGHVLDARIVVKPRDSKRIQLLEALETEVTPTAPLMLPFDTALAINIRARALVKSLTQIEPPQTNTLERNLTALSLGVRNNTNGSPIPDVFASLLMSQLESSQLNIKELARKLLSFAGQSIQWNSTQIEGTPVEFFTTLVGAGVYLGTDTASDSLLVASSETAMRDLLQSTHKKIDTVQRSLPTSVREQFAHSNVCSIVIDFPKTADLLDSVRGTLAMMTGGSSELNQMLDTSELRSFGTLAGSVSYAENIFYIHSTQFLSEQ